MHPTDFSDIEQEASLPSRAPLRLSSQERPAGLALAFVGRADTSRPVPRSLTLLASAAARASAARDDQVATMDHAAARLVEAAHACGVPPSVLLPAQRTLLLLGGRPRRGARPADPQALVAALDDAIGPTHTGGFARLLQSAIDAGEFAATEEVHAEDVGDDEHAAFDVVMQLKRRLLAVDDLTHALDVRPDFPAALALADALVQMIVDGTNADRTKESDASEQAEFCAAWLEHRGVSSQLVDVVRVRAGEDDLTDAIAAAAKSFGVGQCRALGLWLMSDQLSERRRPKPTTLPNWHALLERGKLAALEVFDAADLWLDLDR